MKNKTIFYLLFVALILNLNSLPGECVVKIKSGSITFTSLDESVILPITDTSISVSFGEDRGGRVVAVNIIFQDIADMIITGAEFDIATGIDGESGKVVLNFTDQDNSSNEKVRILTSDSFSKSRGKIKILEANEDGSFSFSIKNTLTNLLIQTEEGFSKKRFHGKIKMNGTILAKKVLE